MNVDFVVKEGVSAIKLATDDSASILSRYVNIPLKDYPELQ